MTYRISGHESFPFRYTWLPKAVRTLVDKPDLFTDEDEAMVLLGVGKNMVRSIRFWSQAAGLSKAAGKTGKHKLTDVGTALLGKDGADPFLEDVQTLWCLISTGEVPEWPDIPDRALLSRLRKRTSRVGRTDDIAAARRAGFTVQPKVYIEAAIDTA